MNKEPRTMQVADAATASRAPENTPAMVKKIGKTTYKVHVHFSNTSTETMSDKIKRILICVAIYAVLIQSVAISGDAINSIWSIVGYTVLLCFSLFKTSSVTKSVLGAH